MIHQSNLTIIEALCLNEGIDAAVVSEHFALRASVANLGTNWDGIRLTYGDKSNRCR